jgi:hypothetical protein
MAFLGYYCVQVVIHAIVTEYVHGLTSFSQSFLYTYYGYIYTWRGSSSFFPLFAPFAIPFVLPLTYLAPSSCDELSSLLSGFLQTDPICPSFHPINRPIPSPPRTPIAQRLTTTTLGPIRFHYAEQEPLSRD